MKLKDENLVVIIGGAKSAAYITSWIKIFTTIMEFGEKIGSSFRRITTGNFC